MWQWQAVKDKSTQQKYTSVSWDDSALPAVQKFDRELIFDDGLSMAFGAKATLVRPSVEIAQEHCKQVSAEEDLRRFLKHIYI